VNWKRIVSIDQDISLANKKNEVNVYDTNVYTAFPNEFFSDSIMFVGGNCRV
jgi:hypothetical protein